eukprot:TRINITY_DN1457_c0_g1_i2.p1 TRINITY_DN1457_c0_g1~~TRINITY_DN1457_c0_g1_i2.p1  ORF type:complete len:122 (-),score=3.75 TRINITY_DN1457_c0_g1_i2:471-836(-)
MYTFLCDHQDMSACCVSSHIAPFKSSCSPFLQDCHMPEMDGLEATAHIRRLPATDLPGGIQPHIVALTASTLSHDREECMRVGMDGFLTKPLRPQELERILKDTVRSRRATEKQSALSNGT